MPLDKKHNAIFIHIPKCGGSSIEKSFGYGHLNRLFGMHTVNNRTYQLQHLTPSEIIELGLMDLDEFRRYKKFCFVRNTYEKIASSYVSYFKMFSRDFEDYIKTVCGIAEQHESGTESLQSIDTWHNQEKYKEKNATYKIPLVDCHFKPQHMYIYLSDENVMDFVGNMETFVEDFDRLCRSFNIEGKILHVHKSKKYDYRELYNEKTKKMIFKAYEKDIDLFKFKF